jgi:hypothetical protein
MYAIDIPFARTQNEFYSWRNKETAMTTLKTLLSIVSVAGVDEEIIMRAVSLGVKIIGEEAFLALLNNVT